MAKVFISYSQDSDAHKERVQYLAAHLRTHTLEVILDQDMLPGGPDKGWDQWCDDQISNLDHKVLMVCTERYCARYEGRENEGVGLGAIAEARLIRHYLNKAGGHNPRFRVVTLDPSDKQHIPASLQTYQSFSISQPADLAGLIAWLTSSPQTTAPTAAPQILWPAPEISFIWDMADRVDITTRLTEMLSGQSSKRILLLNAGTNSGKTHLLSELKTYAQRLPIAHFHFDCKGSGVPIEDFVNLVSLDLPNIFAVAPKNPVELIRNLRQLAQPLLLTFDTYEHVSPTVKSWIEGQLLQRLDTCPGVVVVVAGQQTPELAKQLWANLAAEKRLEPIQDANDWLEYSRRKGHPNVTLDFVKGLTFATGGNPASLSALLEALTAGPKAARSIAMATSVQQAMAKLQAAQGDPQKLALATLNIILSSQKPELRHAFEAAAIPHWFTKPMLAKLLEVDEAQAAEYVDQLARLPMVEPFPARQGWNVHEATRLALRAQLAAEKTEQFRELSAKAAAFFTSDQPHDRIERLFHLFGAQLPDAQSLFDELWNEWHPGSPDNVLALGTALLELETTPSLLPEKDDFQYELAVPVHRPQRHRPLFRSRPTSTDLHSALCEHTRTARRIGSRQPQLQLESCRVLRTDSASSPVIMASPC